MKQILRYMTSLLLVVSPLVSMATGWRSVENIEQPRGDIYPYNSDSLLCDSVWRPSLYVDHVDEWQRSAECDTLYNGKFAYLFEWLNREVILRVASADAPYVVEVNGREVARTTSGNSPMEFHITDFAVEGVNDVALRLMPNSAERAIEGWRVSNKLSDKPIGNVRVAAVARMTVRDVFADVARHENGFSAQIGVVLKSYNLGERLSVAYSILKSDKGARLTSSIDSLRLRMRGEDTIYVSTTLPREALWSAENRNFTNLDLRLQHDWRFVEYHKLPIALRSVEVNSGGDMLINGEKVVLRAARVRGDISRETAVALREEGVNTLLFEAGELPLAALDICDSEGLYAIVTAPIDSRSGGEQITVGGNVTNDPEWLAEYLDRATRSYYAVRRHPSVVAYGLATKSANGNNLYESYLKMKSIERDIPIIYLDNRGEWNSDRLNFEIIK